MKNTRRLRKFQRILGEKKELEKFRRHETLNGYLQRVFIPIAFNAIGRACQADTNQRATHRKGKRNDAPRAARSGYSPDTARLP